MKLLTLISIFCFQLSAFALTEVQAVRAIAGEARGEGLRGETAVACALRNRGTLRGVYGYNTSTRYTAQVLRSARLAWRQSRQHDITHGATHWGTDADIATGTYCGLTKTVKIGRHTFFK